MGADGETGFERIGPDRVDDLFPLYAALAEHHSAIRPQLIGAPARDPATAWSSRRPRYLEWLAAPGFGLLAADAAGAVIGYAVVTIEEAHDSWETGPIGELHDLGVLPRHRGGGLGAKLLAAVRRELRAAAVERYRLNVLSGNDDALRFYEREGLSPVMTALMASTSEPG